jgi:hypothetical protein
VSEITRVFTASEIAQQRAAAEALQHMRELLPSYREVCGAAPYFYAAGEIQRLEYQLVQVYSGDELKDMTQTIRLQLEGLARAIRAAKGRGIELDA